MPVPGAFWLMDGELLAVPYIVDAKDSVCDFNERGVNSGGC